MMAKKEGTHDRGIRERIQQIWNGSDKYHLLAVAQNVIYHDYSRRPIIEGELDILKLYSNGAIGIEEVKSTHRYQEKGKEQLQRAARCFFSYRPSIRLYTVCDKSFEDIDYDGMRR